MWLIILVIVIVIVIVIVTFVLIRKKPSTDVSYDNLKKYIERRFNKKAKYTFNQYEEILKELSNDKYSVTNINEFRNTINDQKIIVGLRHDVDLHPFKALEMAKMENKYGFSSTYFILATEDYYGKINKQVTDRYKSMESVYKELVSLGHEIAIHNDLLAIMVKYKKDPLAFNQEEIEFFNSLGINIFGTAAHGSVIAQKTVPNYEIFSDFCKNKQVQYKGKKYQIGNHSLKEFGFDYEAYFINNNKYYSESRGKWNLKGGYEEFLIALKNSNPGDRIQILTHPVWWGKK